MSTRLRTMTVIGTRPEIIRLAPTIKLLDKTTDHVLVHTGQNSDYEMNEIFFEDLGLRKPDVFLNADTSSLGRILGTTLSGIESSLHEFKPEAFLVLGDTNSAISALMARRLGVPVFHMEAGNRSFDENVPEETNRRFVDHVADYNLVYSENSRRNLLAEGIHPSRILLSGSPMAEVLKVFATEIESSIVLSELGLDKAGYFLVSMHRQENVDEPERLLRLLKALEKLSKEFSLPVLVSTHPRTKRRLDELGAEKFAGLTFHKPFGFLDYMALQMNSKLVLSDSGTISEESSLMGFPAVSLRDAIERPEAVDTAAALLTGSDPAHIIEMTKFAIDMWEAKGPAAVPEAYAIDDFSRRVVSYVMSNARTHHQRSGVRIHI
jgi:UDP-N-acetylglucosamine 2-epimerase